MLLLNCVCVRVCVCVCVCVRVLALEIHTFGGVPVCEVSVMLCDCSTNMDGGSSAVSNKYM